MLVDSHCHLDFPQLIDDLDGVVTRAGEAGVTKILTISTHLSTADKNIQIAEQFAPVYVALGVHPHNAGKEEGDDKVETYEELVGRSAKIVAIGECGLDYFYDYASPDVQATVFKAQIRAAQKLDYPLIIHTRDADENSGRILKEAYEEKPFRAVLHCYTSGIELAQLGLSLGFYVSFSGIVTFKNAQNVRDVCEKVPLERLLVETDSPFLAPVPVRSKTNEPAFVAHTAAFIAGLHDVPVAELQRQTTKNFHQLFARAR